MKTIKDLSVEHDYYCSDNYFSNEWSTQWQNFWDFYEEFKDLDIDMNLVIRFDIYVNNDSVEDEEKSSEYELNIVMIHQRKWILAKHYIYNLVDDDVQNIENYLQLHFDKIKNNWKPFD